MSAPRPAPDSPSHASHGASFQAIYREHFDFVWRCLRVLGVPAASIDDAAQEVFVVAHRRLSSFRGEASLRTWLYGIVRNVAANARRSVRRKSHVQPLEQEPPDEGGGPFDHAATREAVAFVERFVAELDDKKREAFVLAVLEEMTMPEVAASLSVPLNTAYTRVRTAKLAFAEALARQRGQHARIR